jgi:PKD repeat protein
MAIELTAAVVAIAIIVVAANFIITYAQQQQPPTSQPAVTQNGTTLFQNTEDGIRLKVPEGWVIHDVNNTGSTLLEESTQGYGILAQLCPQEEQQQAALSNVSGGDTASCQGSEGDIIHMVRYPDLNTRLQVSNNFTTNNNMTTDNILSYHLQKLQEVGYSGIEIVNSTDTTLNVTNAQTNETIATVQAKNVEITYSTNFAPNETRIGYFILTATDATPPNLGMTKGYSVFYEGNSTTAETRPSGSLEPIPLSVSARQVFDSFELVAPPPAAAPPPPPPAAAPPPPPAAPTMPLTVEITSSDTEGEVAPATFEFDADVTGGIEPYTYSWDFDGESSEEIDDDETEHTFEEAGTYNVGLTVTDSEGQIGSDNMEITVEEAPAEEDNSGSDDLFDVDDIIDDLFTG